MLEAAAKSSILSALPDHLSSRLLPERRRGTSVPAKRSFIPETLVMAAIASIEGYSRLTLSQRVGRH